MDFPRFEELLELLGQIWHSVWDVQVRNAQDQHTAVLLKALIYVFSATYICWTALIKFWPGPNPKQQQYASIVKKVRATPTLFLIAAPNIPDSKHYKWT
jgi:hypothetical protein